MFDHIIHIPLTVWRAYVRRVRAAKGSRRLAWIVVPILGLLMLFGMLAPTPPAAPTSAADPTAKRTSTRQAAPTATIEPVVDVAPTEEIDPVAEQPTEAPVVDEPAAAPVVDEPAAAPVSGPVAPSGGECPPEAMIKGNQGDSEWIYHRPGGSSYSRTDPEQCFATAADAEAAGYRAAKR